MVRLPPEVLRELRAVTKIDELSWPDIVTRAKGLLAKQDDGGNVVML